MKSNLIQDENPWTRIAAFAGVALFFVYLFFIQGYSTGYEFERMSIWENMRNGYSLDGGEWSFGYFVPLAVLGLAWVRRKDFMSAPISPSWWGLLVICFGLFLYFAGYKTNQKYIGYMSGQILLAGSILWLAGPAVFRRVFWLWVLFAMTWPFVPFTGMISFPLQKVMAAMTTGTLNLIGESVVRNGTAVMSAPDGATGLEMGERFSLKVAAACSGLRSLFALVMLSLVMGLLLLRDGWKRLILLMTAIPLAVFGNFVRMILLYIGTVTMGAEFAIGGGEHDPSGYHIMAGIMVFFVAVAGMLVVIAILQHGSKVFKRKQVKVRKVNRDRDKEEKEWALAAEEGGEDVY